MKCDERLQWLPVLFISQTTVGLEGSRWGSIKTSHMYLEMGLQLVQYAVAKKTNDRNVLSLRFKFSSSTAANIWPLTVWGLHGKVFVAGGCRGSFFKKNPEAAPH